MAGADWALAVLIIYPLLQVPAVLYLSRHVELDGSDDVDVELAEQGYVTYPTNVETADPGPGVRCPRCGAANDPAFTRCHSCVARLDHSRSPG